MRHLIPIIISLISFGFIQTIHAQQGFKYGSHTMKIAGTSTLHDWESNVTKLSGNATISIDDNRLSGISQLQISIPVESIISTKGSIMDNKTYEALKSDKHPNITFKLSYVSNIQATGNAQVVTAQGNLTMAGSTKYISMEVKAILNSDGSITFQGSKDLKMTDFGVSPPTAMLGSIKTGDDITITFSMKLIK